MPQSDERQGRSQGAPTCRCSICDPREKSQRPECPSIPGRPGIGDGQPSVRLYRSSGEWSAEGGKGFLVPGDRPDILSEKVVRAVKERRLRTEAKKKNLAIVKSKAEEDLIMDGLIKCYRKMIAEK